MKTNYLEMIEELFEEDLLEQQPQIVRIQVKDEEEAKKLFPKYESLFKDRSYKVQYHVHFHSKDGNNIPCKIKILKKVEKSISGLEKERSKKNLKTFLLI